MATSAQACAATPRKPRGLEVYATACIAAAKRRSSIARGVSPWCLSAFTTVSPNGAAVRSPSECRPLGAKGQSPRLVQGLTPLAISERPVGADCRCIILFARGASFLPTPDSLFDNSPPSPGLRAESILRPRCAPSTSADQRSSRTLCKLTVMSPKMCFCDISGRLATRSMAASSSMQLRAFASATHVDSIVAKNAFATECDRRRFALAAQHACTEEDCPVCPRTRFPSLFLKIALTPSDTTRGIAHPLRAAILLASLPPWRAP
jgi:hypothetical protein